MRKKMNNFSFVELLTKEILIDEENQKTININKIKIPMIQRDYAQGRKIIEEDETEKLSEKGRRFLDSIFDHLVNDEPMELDFIYGSIEEDKKEFEPLDGQQRLTTLFLLYWYIGSKELNHDTQEYKNILEILNKFSYATRTSSRRFCDLLCNSKKTQIDFLKNPSEQLKKLPWFFKTYLKDPTIKAMLFMLDSIHKKYIELNCSSVFKSLENLRFYPFPLNGFNLTEDLYIKMNARGKELTNFENFKADFIKWMQNKDINGDLFFEKKEYKSIKDMPYYMVISNKIDNEWTDFFWTLTRDNDEKTFVQAKKGSKIEKPTVIVDPYFMRLISRYLLNMFISNSEVEAARIDKTEDYNKILASENFENFDIFEKILNLDVIKKIEIVLDKLSLHWTKIEPYCKASWENEDKYFWEQNITNKDRVMLYAITSYLEINEFDEKSFATWMRVAYNIVENADIDSVRVMTGCIRYFKDALLLHSADIYKYLATVDVDKSFATKQVEEEILKSKFINNYPDENWEQEFINAESHPFFRGCVGFMIDEGMSINTFTHRYSNSKDLFEKNGVSERFRKKHLLLRALIKKYTEFKDFCSNTNHFTDKEDPEHFLKKKLVDDKSFISTLKDYCDLPNLEDIERAAKIDAESVSSINLPVELNADEKTILTIRSIHDAFNSVQLLDWMDEEKAIRFSCVGKHYYVSTPCSWYSWIMLDSDRSKYFDYFESKGFTTISRKIGQFLTRKEIIYTGKLNNIEYQIKFSEDNKVRIYKSGDETVLEEIEYRNEIDITSQLEEQFFLKY